MIARKEASTTIPDCFIDVEIGFIFRTTQRIYRDNSESLARFPHLLSSTPARTAVGRSGPQAEQSSSKGSSEGRGDTKANL